jgi:hypothetical protein
MSEQLTLGVVEPRPLIRIARVDRVIELARAPGGYRVTLTPSRGGATVRLDVATAEQALDALAGVMRKARPA